VFTNNRNCVFVSNDSWCLFRVRGDYCAVVRNCDDRILVGLRRRGSIERGTACDAGETIVGAIGRGFESRTFSTCRSSCSISTIFVFPNHHPVVRNCKERMTFCFQSHGLLELELCRPAGTLIGVGGVAGGAGWPPNFSSLIKRLPSSSCTS
jgi:hypothetical protein